MLYPTQLRLFSLLLCLVLVAGASACSSSSEASVPAGDAAGGEPEGDGEPASEAMQLTGTCDLPVLRNDRTFHYARFDVPGLDPRNPPDVVAVACDRQEKMPMGDECFALEGVYFSEDEVGVHCTYADAPVYLRLVMPTE